MTTTNGANGVYVLMTGLPESLRLVCPKRVPWDMIAPHEAQAERNHGGQSLSALSARGGLSPWEIYAVVHGLPHSKMRHMPEVTKEFAVEWLKEWIAGEQR